MVFSILAVAVAAFLPSSVEIAQSPASFKNIKISPIGGGGMAPCEPSIAISQLNPKIVVAGVILDKAVFTSDWGATWEETKLTSPFGVHGDPTIISDSKGAFYFFHLSNGGGDRWIDRIVCQKSVDGGRTWSSGASIGENHPADQDKQWAAAHPSKPTLVCTWTQFDTYGSRDPLKRSNIMFSQSVDAGETWSKAFKINDVSGDCLDGDNTTEGAVPAIDSAGNIFVCWSNAEMLWFDRSMDGGKTWLKKDLEISKQHGGWEMTIPGINRSNGMPVLMVDNSPGKFNGHLYVLFADQRNGTNDTDIFLIKSTDKGDTWSKPLRVNQDPAGKQQFLPWLAIDQSSGNVYAVYYDRRAYDDNKSDVYVAFSTDGGATFTERKISESPFVPTAGTFFGDYNNISANKGIIAPIWTRMDDGKTSVWTAMLRHSDLIKP